MPRVNFVKSARKANPLHGIEVGDSYYHWAFAFGPKQYSKTPPKRQQLTRSGFLIQVYNIEDALANWDGGLVSLESIRDEIENLHGETEEHLSNMPDHLQDCSPAGELLQSRIDMLGEMMSPVIDVINEWDELSPRQRAEIISEVTYSGE